MAATLYTENLLQSTGEEDDEYRDDVDPLEDLL
jgi:hypothetical protein